MKKIAFLVIGFLVLTNLTVKAQATIAKLKYEDAEEAYSKGDYPLAITKLDEAEGILKATNPKILYLRIMAQSKMIEKEPYKDFAALENARRLSAQYLKDYETIPDNEDKYRDIYKVSEALLKYPKTQAEMETIRDRPAKTLRVLMYKFKFKLGLTAEAFKAYNPEAAFLLDQSVYITKNGTSVYSITDHRRGPHSAEFKNGILIRYKEVFGSLPTEKEGRELLGKWISYFKENFGEEFIEHTDSFFSYTNPDKTIGLWINYSDYDHSVTMDLYDEILDK